jgi:hypothetical protein
LANSPIPYRIARSPAPVRFPALEEAGDALVKVEVKIKTL